MQFFSVDLAETAESAAHNRHSGFENRLQLRLKLRFAETAEVDLFLESQFLSQVGKGIRHFLSLLQRSSVTGRNPKIDAERTVRESFRLSSRRNNFLRTHQVGRQDPKTSGVTHGSYQFRRRNTRHRR